MHNYFVNLHHVHGEGGDGTGHNNEVHAVPHLPEEGPGVQHQTIQNYLKNNENYLHYIIYSICTSTFPKLKSKKIYLIFKMATVM